MKHHKLHYFLENSLIPLDSETYFKLIIILAPLLNFLSGLNMDLYTPSMPAIAHYYGASFTAVKNTVTATLLGFSLGCILFGILLDILGRRRTILIGLFLYMLASFAALLCRHIEQLIFIRFLQGVTIATVAVGCRALIIDNFTGHRFTIGLMYASLGYGLGPIIAPFIGGVLQYYFGWKANFLTYGLFTLALIIIFALFVKESIVQRHVFSIRNIAHTYLLMLKHPTFLAGTALSGGSQIILMLYSTVGSFIVEGILHHTPITYGNTALLIGCGYLLGTLTNRLLIKRFDLHQLTAFGFAALLVGAVLQIVIALLNDLNLITLITPVFIMCYSQGFINPNTMARTFRLFPHNAGMAAALLLALCMVLTSIAIFFVSHVDVNTLGKLAVIFTLITIFQLITFVKFFKRSEF